MVTLIIHNRFAQITGLDRKLYRKLDQATSYLVAGHRFYKAFKKHQWDGREHLLKFSKKNGVSIPSGLVYDVTKTLKSLGVEYKILDKRRRWHQKREIIWNDEKGLRPYQKRALKAWARAEVPGLGTLKMPIRSGKTRTAAKIIQKTGVPALFIVPSKMLLHQTVQTLRECMPNEPIGVVGDGMYDVQFITAATVQTLSRMRSTNDPKYKDLLKAFDLIVGDEIHHYRGSGEWYKIFYDFNVAFRVGLSATIFPDSETEVEHGIMWAKGLFGGICFEVPVSELIDNGYLMRQNVEMYRIKEPMELLKSKWSQTLLNRGIIENKYRNKKIVELAKRETDLGARVLIVTNRLNHIAILSEMLDEIGIDHRVITGKNSSEERNDLIEGFVAGRYLCILGTVLREGVDIPEVEVVINAEGWKDEKNAIQRQRNLTIAEGKKRALMIDFVDEFNQYFFKHSMARLKTYQSESAFLVQVIE